MTERGSLAGSFVPPEDIRRLRTHTRYRRRLTQARTAEKQRAGKLLEDAQLTELLGRIAVSGGSARGRAVRFPGHDQRRGWAAGSVVAEGAALRGGWGDGLPVWAVSGCWCRWRGCRAGGGVSEGSAGVRAPGGYAAVICDGPAALVPVLGGGGRRMGSGHQGEARDFCCWIQLAGKPGGPAPGARYAAATVAHCETVLRCFYDFHLEAGTGPMVNPFPLARRAGPAECASQPDGAVPGRACGAVPAEDTAADSPADPGWEVQWAVRWARVAPGPGSGGVLGVHGRPGRRAAGCQARGCRPGAAADYGDPQGTRALQRLPASPDAFVWLRLYQQQMHGLVPAGPDDPLWWTMRRPFRPLTYHAARAMFTRASAALGGQLAAAWPSPYGGLPDGPGPGNAADRRAVGSRACAPVHHAALPDRPRWGRHRRGRGAPRPQAGRPCRAG